MWREMMRGRHGRGELLMHWRSVWCHGCRIWVPCRSGVLSVGVWKWIVHATAIAAATTVTIVMTVVSVIMTVVATSTTGRRMGVGRTLVW